MKLGVSERPKEATFDLTPMIDVLLLLIVFFMMTSQFTRTQLMPVNLPREEGERGAPTSPSSMFIDMDATGGLHVLGRPIRLEEIGQVIGPARPGADAAALDLVVRADRSCPSAHLNRLAEALARAGVRNWKLATAPQGTRRPSQGTGGAG
jgi:biopolymer transport protein ExbD